MRAIGTQEHCDLGSPIRARFDTGYDPDIVSNLDPIDWRIRGWAYSKVTPEVPVELQVIIDGQEFARVLCDDVRLDLASTEHPDSCGFDLALPAEIGDGHRHFVDVRVASSGRRLAGAPTIVEHTLIRSPIRPGSLALDTINAEFGDLVDHLVGQQHAAQDGTLGVGSTSERFFDDPTEIDQQLDDLLLRAEAAFPFLEGVRVLERWAGVRPRAMTRSPMLGAHPLHEGQFIANGGFKIGFGMAPKVGEVMADLLLDGRDAIPEGFSPEASL